MIFGYTFPSFTKDLLNPLSCTDTFAPSGYLLTLSFFPGRYLTKMLALAGVLDRY